MELEQRPLAAIADIVAIEEGRVETDSKTGAARERVFQSHRFSRGRNGNVTESVGPARRPFHVRHYDAAGRLVRQDGQMVDGGTGREFSYTETVRYDADGNVAGVELVRDGKPVHTVTGKTEPLPGGGKRTRIEDTSPTGEPTAEIYDFNAKSELVRYELASGKRPNPPYLITRNDRGDVASYRFGEKGALNEYEYKYDDRGNWVRREQFRTENGKRESVMVEFRRITYGPARAAVAAATAPVRPASRPAAAAPAPVERDALAKLAGTYAGEIGKPGDGVQARNRIELRPDGTLVYSQATTFNGQTTEKEATGRWSVEGGAVVLKLEKSTKGPPVPAGAPPMRFTPGKDGKSLVGPDGKRVFPRVG